MKSSLHQHAAISIHLAIFALVIAAGSFISSMHQKEAEFILLSVIEGQESRMINLLELTDRNAADDETKSIIHDCPRRTEFEGMLVRLGTLTKPEMVSMQAMFENCGSFYVVQKAIMVSKLRHQYDNYYLNITMYDEFTDSGALLARAKEFGKIITLEEERSSLLSEQQEIQSDIINQLLAGNGVTSSEVSQLVQRAQDIAELLQITDQKIDRLRTEVVT